MIIYRKIMYIFIIQILSAKYNRARESIFAGGGRGRMGKKKDGGRKAGEQMEDGFAVASRNAVLRRK